MKDTAEVLKKKIMRWVRNQAEEREVTAEDCVDDVLE
jgi:hypothetical protein